MYMETVYLDVLFVLNFIVNYMLLLVTGRLFSQPVSRHRLCAAAGLGALYSVLFFLPLLDFFFSTAAKLAVGVCMTIITYGIRPLSRILKLSLAFCCVTFAFCGVIIGIYALVAPSAGLMRNGVLYVEVNIIQLLLATVFFYCAITLAFRGVSRRKKLAEIIIRHMGRDVKLNALLDTGNNLTDPACNYPVIIVDYKALRQVLPSDFIADGRLLDAVDIMEQMHKSEHGFRLIPFKTVGQPLSMLLAFKPEKCSVDGQAGKYMIALSPTSFDDKYDAIIG